MFKDVANGCFDCGHALEAYEHVDMYLLFV